VILAFIAIFSVPCSLACNFLGRLFEIKHLGSYRLFNPASAGGGAVACSLFFVFSFTTVRVWPNARSSDCLGIFVTSGFSNQPKPQGMSRVSDSASHCR